MCLLHCVAIFYNLPSFCSIKVSYNSLQCNDENACGKRMCNCALRLINFIELFLVLQNVGGKISVEMQTPKLLWIKNNLGDVWSKAKYFFDLADFLTWRATGRESKVRSLCTTVCKWTYQVLSNRKREIQQGVRYA